MMLSTSRKRGRRIMQKVSMIGTRLLVITERLVITMTTPMTKLQERVVVITGKTAGTTQMRTAQSTLDLSTIWRYPKTAQKEIVAAPQEQIYLRKRWMPFFWGATS